METREEERPLLEWVTPSFACVPLNQALYDGGAPVDGGASGIYS